MSRLIRCLRLLGLCMAMAAAGAGADEPGGNFDSDLFGSWQVASLNLEIDSILSSRPDFPSRLNAHSDVLQRLDQLEQHISRLNAENRWLHERPPGTGGDTVTDAKDAEGSRAPEAVLARTWEAGLRYSWLDLNDGTAQGGKLNDITCGLNWHLNPNSRFMFNYIMMHRDAPDPDATGWASIIASRFQIDF